MSRAVALIAVSGSVVVAQLEMRSQDLQLAQTLLGLNTEIQRLRRESFGGADADGDEQH